MLFKPNDLIRVGDDFWEIQGVHLGALNQESVIEVSTIAMRAPVAHGEPAVAMVPDLMLRALVQSGQATHYTEAE